MPPAAGARRLTVTLPDDGFFMILATTCCGMEALNERLNNTSHGRVHRHR
jgi:hypothetical protein